MLVVSYGSIEPAQQMGPPRSMSVRLAGVGALLCSIVLALALTWQSGSVALMLQLTAGSSEVMQTRQMLLGYDPVRSNKRTGTLTRRDDTQTTEGSFEFKENEAEVLPQWAIEWAHPPEDLCLPGAQCDHGKSPNPLGTLGLWVMRKTTPHFNTKYDYRRRKNCAGMPGWELEECHHIRDMESHLDENGFPKDESKAAKQAVEQADEADESVPVMLHEISRPLQIRRRMRQAQSAQLHLKADLDLLLEKVDNFDVQ